MAGSDFDPSFDSSYGAAPGSYIFQPDSFQSGAVQLSVIFGTAAQTTAETENDHGAVIVTVAASAQLLAKPTQTASGKGSVKSANAQILPATQNTSETYIPIFGSQDITLAGTYSEASGGPRRLAIFADFLALPPTQYARAEIVFGGVIAQTLPAIGSYLDPTELAVIHATSSQTIPHVQMTATAHKIWSMHSTLTIPMPATVMTAHVVQHAQQCSSIPLPSNSLSTPIPAPVLWQGGKSIASGYYAGHDGGMRVILNATGKVGVGVSQFSDLMSEAA